jgi:glycosyltransferase involved in cell wall biosynthesis
MMRVLLVTHYFAGHRSGIELVAAALARRLVHDDLTITWAASAPADAERVDGITPLPMRTWNVAERRFGFPYPLWGPLSLLRLARAVRRCHVVHLHDCLYLGNVFAFLWARWHGKPVVVTQHIGMIPYSSRLLRGLLATANHLFGRLVLGGCERCVFISPQVRAYFSRFVHFRRPPLYLANGVDTSLFHPVDSSERRRLRTELGWPADRLVLLFVGRFVEKKGLSLLRRLAEQFTEAEWVFVGWGPESPQQWGLPNVRCPGALPQSAIAACYQSADLLVLPSVGEGFPLVVQEAAACGTPALISADTARGCPGIETVALVSDLRWEPLTEQVRALIAHPEQLAARRDAAADFSRRWDWESCAARYRQLFADVAASEESCACR